MKCVECGSGSMFFDRPNDNCIVCISKRNRQQGFDEGKTDKTVTRTVIEFKKGDLLPVDGDDKNVYAYLIPKDHPFKAYF